MLSNSKRQAILHNIELIQNKLRTDVFNRCWPISAVMRYFPIGTTADEFVDAREQLIEKAHKFMAELNDVYDRVRSVPDISTKDIELLQNDLNDSPIKSEFVAALKASEEILKKIPSNWIKSIHRNDFS